MSEFFEDEKTELPSLWRVKAEMYVWTLIFGAVFFLGFYSIVIRGSIQVANPLQGLMQASEWNMTVVWLGVICCSIAFNKVYCWWNPAVITGNTQLLTLINKKIDNLHSTLPEMKADISEIKDVVITYADKVPEVPI